MDQCPVPQCPIVDVKKEEKKLIEILRNNEEVFQLFKQVFVQQDTLQGGSCLTYRSLQILIVTLGVFGATLGTIQSARYVIESYFSFASLLLPCRDTDRAVDSVFQIFFNTAKISMDCVNREKNWADISTLIRTAIFGAAGTGAYAGLSVLKRVENFLCGNVESKTENYDPTKTYSYKSVVIDNSGGNPIYYVQISKVGKGPLSDKNMWRKAVTKFNRKTNKLELYFQSGFRRGGGGTFQALSSI